MTKRQEAPLLLSIPLQAPYKMKYRPFQYHAAFFEEQDAFQALEELPLKLLR